MEYKFLKRNTINTINKKYIKINKLRNLKYINKKNTNKKINNNHNIIVQSQVFYHIPVECMNEFTLFVQLPFICY